MSLGIQALLALTPILLAALLLVGFRWPAKWAMPVAYIVAVLIALAAWQVSFAQVALQQTRCTQRSYKLNR